MLTLSFALLVGIILALILLIFIDEESSIKVPFLHRKVSIVDMSTKTAFISAFIFSMVKHIKDWGTVTISNICRLTNLHKEV
ncbi:hypothetical protein HMPREF9477_01099 [Lachnospiraceae bacterium 2_1_46FAA]|nr:hypothetical protein HMPREF9477_01099 [Lachnospiraceae bacterium 2_1_46FAA]